MAKPKLSKNSTEDEMLRNLDLLSEYDSYATEVAPILRQAVTQGWSPDKIFKHFQSYLAARAVTIALNDKDSGKALAALKDLMDRSVGKATEKIETTHRLEKLGDADLDKMLASLVSESELTKSN